MNLGLFFLSKFLFLVIPALISVAFLTLAERKVLSLVGFRMGPWKVSLLGILQPIGDAGKLLNKESNILSMSSYMFYYISTFFMLSMSLFLFFNLSFDPLSVGFKINFLILFVILGLNSLASIFTGWSTFNKYSLIGSLRTVSQLISYEVLLYVCFFFFLCVYFCLDFSRFNWDYLSFFFLFFPFLFILWFFSVLAELNRTPFDFSEGESELVSGFNVDFGSAGFTLIFLAEYGNILFFMILTTFLFIGSLALFYFSFFLLLLVLWVRSVLPRYRFDKLLGLSWKILLPLIGFFFMFYFSIIF